jgi:hypothetical protein
MIKLLPYYLKQGKNINKYYEVLGELFDEVIQAIAEITLYRDVEKAKGYGLDIIGDILGQTREGLEDEAYRDILRIKIVANRSPGDIETLNDFGRLILKQYFEGIYQANEPAKIILRYTYPLVPNAVQLLKKAVAAGVQVTDEIDSYVPICGTLNCNQQPLDKVFCQVGGGNTA